MKNVIDRKIAKGYRLKPETHKIIKRIQNLLRGDIDYTLSTVCKKFLRETKQHNKSKEIN